MRSGPERFASPRPARLRGPQGSRPSTRWVFLSPHFDDVALSAGGLIWELVRGTDQVEVWTVCAGAPPAGRPLTEYGAVLHAFLGVQGDVPRLRSKEDAASCRVLGVSARLALPVPDNVYRYYPDSDQPVVTVPEDNLSPLEPRESYLIAEVAGRLRKELGRLPAGCEVVAPLAVGGHRDHVLTRLAAERAAEEGAAAWREAGENVAAVSGAGAGATAGRAATQRPAVAHLGALWYYVDFPYVLAAEGRPNEVPPAAAQPLVVEITAAGLQAWQRAVACHRSQLPLLFPDGRPADAIGRYWESGGGRTLYRAGATPAAGGAQT